MKPLQKPQAVRITHTGLYILLAVISLLFITNAAMLVKKRLTATTLQNADVSLAQLQGALDTVKLQLNTPVRHNQYLPPQLIAQHQQAQNNLQSLQQQLQSNNLSRQKLSAIAVSVNRLKVYAADYNAHYQASLNTALTKQPKHAYNPGTLPARTGLPFHPHPVAGTVTEAPALAVTNLRLNAVKISSSGSKTTTTHAAKAHDLAITFNLPGAFTKTPGRYPLYLRVFDPAGNLIANQNDFFNAKGQQLQYSAKTTLLVTTSTGPYTMRFSNPQQFMQGTYTVWVYINGVVAGQEQITLN